MPNFINSLKISLCRLHGVSQIQQIETHISWILLTGKIVYKIKKPVDLGFVDFTTLEKRRHYCFEELHLNKRLAPELYIDVVAITTNATEPAINGDGTVIDYAVRLHQFDLNDQFDVLISHHKLTLDHIRELAAIIADFHGTIKRAASDSQYGEPQTIHNATTDSYQHCLDLVREHLDIQRLNTLKSWSDTEYARIHEVLATRKRSGFVRECHGDLHLGNIAIYNGKITPFDCIEFNPEFRWIDVISEVAFLVMDLIARGRQDMATLYLNEYLTRTGDFQGLTCLRYYLVYRSMVRAKVEIIRASQIKRDPRHEHTALSNYYHFVDLASTFCHSDKPMIIITHGLSGSGKSTIARKLQQFIFSIHLRSDVERKRLYKLQATDKTDSAIDQGIYSKEASRKTYDKLLMLSDLIIRNHWNVIVDATFLQQQDRNRFRELANQRNATFIILDCVATQTSLEKRILSRTAEPSNVSEATLGVLQHQLSADQPVADYEQKYCIKLDTDRAIDFEQLVIDIHQKSL
ncbi:bifunctional aminoglycoside phosphotransferase/ATP-binding protein [Kaarinaea lacus]